MGIRSRKLEISSRLCHAARGIKMLDNYMVKCVTFPDVDLRSETALLLYRLKYARLASHDADVLLTQLTGDNRARVRLCAIGGWAGLRKRRK